MEFPQSKFNKNADSVASVQRDERRTEGAALYFTVTAFLFDPVISTLITKITVFPENSVFFLIFEQYTISKNRMEFVFAPVLKRSFILPFLPPAK